MPDPGLRSGGAKIRPYSASFAPFGSQPTLLGHRPVLRAGPVAAAPSRRSPGTPGGRRENFLGGEKKRGRRGGITLQARNRRATARAFRPGDLIRAVRRTKAEQEHPGPTTSGQQAGMVGLGCSCGALVQRTRAAALYREKGRRDFRHHGDVQSFLPILWAETIRGTETSFGSASSRRRPTGLRRAGGDLLGSGGGSETYWARDLGGGRTRPPTWEQDVLGLRPGSVTYSARDPTVDVAKTTRYTPAHGIPNQGSKSR